MTLYCPYCLAPDSDWQYVYYSKKQHCIVGCDSCATSTDESTTCPVCGAEDVNYYKDKSTGEIIGCDKCIVMYDYADCREFCEEDMI